MWQGRVVAGGLLPAPPLYYWPGFTPRLPPIGPAAQFSHPTILPLEESTVTGPATVILLGASALTVGTICPGKYSRLQNRLRT